ncbi:MAG: caspase domain-containing protein [bacterium]
MFVYYSGHGVPDETGEQYFVPYDIHPKYASHSGYSLKTLYNNLAKLHARSITLVIDACFSGTSAGGQQLVPAVSDIIIRSKAPIFTLKNGVIFTSCAADQVSYWYPDKKHGLFTYFFLKGLQGDADTDGDRQITVQELCDYVRTNVRDMAVELYQGRAQEPQIIGDPDRVLFSY